MVAFFFDLLAQLEHRVGVRLDFEDESGLEPVGPEFGEIFARWVGSDVDEEQETVEQIRGFREGVDLPVTDEIVERLVQLGFGGTAIAGIWELPEESTRREMREAEIEAGGSRLQAHVAEHRAAYAGCWIEWQAGVPTLLVAFVGALAAHEAAIAAPGIRAVSAKHALVELERISDELVSEQALPQGIEVYEVGVDHADNVVEVVAHGPDEKELEYRALLEHRYGDAVRLEWKIGGAIAC